MEDSFFGFNTSVSLYDDVGGGSLEEPSEEEYDALNDETFGCATNGDWEEAHENLVRLKDDADDSNDGHQDDILNIGDGQMRTSKTSNRENLSDSDLELNLSDMKFDDIKVDESHNFINNENVMLDPSVWSASPLKPTNLMSNAMRLNESDAKAMAYLRHFQSLYPSTNLQGSFGVHSNSNELKPKVFSNPSPVPNICTLEDIEKNLLKHNNTHYQPGNIGQVVSHPSTPSRLQNNEIKPQTFLNNTIPLHNQNQFQYGPPGFYHNSPNVNVKSTNTQIKNGVNLMGHMNQQQMSHRNDSITMQSNLMSGGNSGLVPKINPMQGTLPQPRNMNPAAVTLIPPHLHHGVTTQLPPHPLLNHGINKTFPFPHHRAPIPASHLPIALNNFAMHPNFAAMRETAAAAAGVHPAYFMTHQQGSARFPNQLNATAIQNQSQPNAIFNMYNTRLVQEIQKNHPLLHTGVRQPQPNLTNLQNAQQKLCNVKNNTGRREVTNANGNLPEEEFDEYANLMSTRDKHWLIGIQLSQLNSDTPYIDDYYFTVYRERRAALNGSLSLSRAHKDNKLNHPLTQPKGHAQLVMVQLGNKNGTRNGQQRERRISENNDQRSSFVFVNCKFENSLGKIQFGSVNAPRKLIDAEVMNSESTSTTSLQISKIKAQAETCLDISPIVNGNINKVTLTTQRKTRDVLLHIEALFRVVLKLEDLENPTIMATIMTKIKKESERLAVIEQMESAKSEEGLENTGSQALNPVLRNRFNYEVESKETLLQKLYAGLSTEKVVSMMNVRKGKVLLCRLMPHLRDSLTSWTVWIGIFNSIPNLIKKDPDDADAFLHSLYPEFKKQISSANHRIIVKIASAVPLEERKSNAILSNKFVMSAIVALILRVEQIYKEQSDKSIEKHNEEDWKKFLKKAAICLEYTIENQTISASIESDAIQPIINHFIRFKSLNLNAFSNFIKATREQVN